MLGTTKKLWLYSSAPEAWSHIPTDLRSFYGWDKVNSEEWGQLRPVARRTSSTLGAMTNIPFIRPVSPLDISTAQLIRWDLNNEKRPFQSCPWSVSWKQPEAVCETNSPKHAWPHGGSLKEPAHWEADPITYWPNVQSQMAFHAICSLSLAWKVAEISLLV